MDHVRMVALSFHCYRETDIATARGMLVRAAQECLEAYNNNDEIRPYLANYPFEPKNIEIWMWFYQPDRRDLPPECLQFAIAINGKISYDDIDPETLLSHTMHKESFEEAVRIVNAQNHVENK